MPSTDMEMPMNVVVVTLQHTFQLFRKKMHFKILKKTYELSTGKQNSLTFH